MRKTATFVTLLMIALLAAACGPRRVSVQTSPEMPAARADLRVGTDDNDNTTIDLRVQHLAEPQKLTPPRTAYMVWIQPQGRETPELLGQLQVNQNLEGRLQTVTPYREFELIVTAEDGPTVTQPSGHVVVRTPVTR